MLRPRAKWPQSNATTETKSNTTRECRTCTHVERACTHARRTCTHVERARAWRRFSVSDPSREGGALLTASLTSQRAALHMRGGASCSSVARTQRAGPMPLPVLPPRRLPSAAAAASQRQHAMCQTKVRTGGNLHQQHWISPGPFCARAGSAPALARAWTAPCRCRPARGAGRARQRGRVVRQAQTPASAQPRQHIHRSRAQRLEQLAEAVLHSMRRSRRFG